MRSEGGAIVLVGTDAARHTTPGESVIGAFGAAVIAMTKTLAKELAGRKIRVNAMTLTLTSDTPTWDQIFAGASFQCQLFTKALKRFPAGRAPTAEDMKNDASRQVFLVEFRRNYLEIAAN